MSQPFLIDKMIQTLGFDPNTTKGATNNTPAGYPLLNKDENDPTRKGSWKYRGTISMIGYLQGTTLTDIAMETHQCAKFNNDPHLSHERAVKCIVRYLLSNRDNGMIYIPDTSQGLERYVDDDFAGAWENGDNDSPGSVLSRTGFVIMYAGCPINWGRKCEQKFPSVLRKESTLLCKPQ